MSVNINEFKLFTEYCANKVQIGGTLSPSQFNELSNRAQMVVFEKDRAIFLATQEISDFLSLFLKENITSVPLTGMVSYPSDLEHTASIRSYYVRPDGASTEVAVQPVKNYDWGEIASSQVQTPTKRFPKYTEFAQQYRFLPFDIGTVMINYFKTPVAPVWGYTTPSGRPVYDPATSTDFEFDSFAFNNVSAVFLQLIGVNLKDGDIASFAQMFTMETNSKL